MAAEISGSCHGLLALPVAPCPSLTFKAFLFLFSFLALILWLFPLAPFET